MPWSENSRATARLVLFSFLLTFVAARVLVYGIMAHDIPDLFLYVGGTHVHHLNYGIFLLSIVGAYLLFFRPDGRSLRGAAVAYAAGLALTFDEFGMWLHLGGSYWQRASFDAVTVVAISLALVVYAPRWRAFRLHNYWGLAIALLAIVVFFVLWSRAARFAEHSLIPRLEQIEQQAPP